FPHLAKWVSGSGVLKLARYLESRRNPRDREYMEQLAKRLVRSFDSSHVLLVEDAGSLGRLNWEKINEMVILWADANGAGWASIERAVFKQRGCSTRVYVLNGRGRLFELNKVDWTAFKWRRLLEKTLVVEFGLMLGILLITPWLTLWDFLRGRR